MAETSTGEYWEPENESTEGCHFCGDRSVNRDVFGCLACAARDPEVEKHNDRIGEVGKCDRLDCHAPENAGVILWPWTEALRRQAARSM